MGLTVSIDPIFSQPQPCGRPLFFVLCHLSLQLSLPFTRLTSPACAAPKTAQLISDGVVPLVQLQEPFFDVCRN